MNTSKIRKPTTTQIVKLALTVVVFAASLSAGVGVFAWILAMVPPGPGVAFAGVIALLSAIGVEAMLSTFADEAVKSVGLRHQNREVVR